MKKNYAPFITLCVYIKINFLQRIIYLIDSFVSYTVLILLDNYTIVI